jgi:hypothetical protein
MKTFDIIKANIGRRSRRIAGIVRPDLSTMDLKEYERDGATQVVFVANIEADPECEALNGNVYDIKTLLTFDNPIYRTSHPNCQCKFVTLPANEIPR